MSKLYVVKKDGVLVDSVYLCERQYSNEKYWSVSKKKAMTFSRRQAYKTSKKYKSEMGIDIENAET